MPPWRLDPEEVLKSLIAFINSNIMARGHPIQPDEPFDTAGLDSMALLKVFLFVETEFGFWVPDDDLVSANVASPRALANYLCRHRASAQPGSS
jgi:acyl carrier protein